MMVNGVALPGGGWNDEITQQFQWARSSATYMAQVYAAVRLLTGADRRS